MGCGTADGAPAADGGRWFDEVRDAMKWIEQSFSLLPMHWIDESETRPSAGDPDATWLVPVSYHEAFDEFRRSAAGEPRGMVGRRIAALTNLQIDALVDTPFAWRNCLDVLLWWADRDVARRQATTDIVARITAVDQRARAIGVGTVRRILCSHSLGTAATTVALRHLGMNSADWLGMGGFDSWFTLANVAPFVMSDDDVYAAPLAPARSGAVCKRMVNVRHETDPIPWLMPWRAWAPPTAGLHAGVWRAGRSRLEHPVDTHDVLAPPGRAPDIAHVHGFANYLLSEAVAPRLAGLIRGELFDDASLASLGMAAKRHALPQLRCADGTALSSLRDGVSSFREASGQPALPPNMAPPAGQWVDRLLRAADLLASAQQRCNG
jgi:hypothetical protein